MVALDNITFSKQFTPTAVYFQPPTFERPFFYLYILAIEHEKAHSCPQADLTRVEAATTTRIIKQGKVCDEYELVRTKPNQKLKRKRERERKVRDESNRTKPFHSSRLPSLNSPVLFCVELFFRQRTDRGLDLAN